MCFAPAPPGGTNDLNHPINRLNQCDNIVPQKNWRPSQRSCTTRQLEMLLLLTSRGSSNLLKLTLMSLISSLDFIRFIISSSVIFPPLKTCHYQISVFEPLNHFKEFSREQRVEPSVYSLLPMTDEFWPSTSLEVDQNRVKPIPANVGGNYRPGRSNVPFL